MPRDQVASRPESDTAQREKQPDVSEKLEFSIEKAGAVDELFGQRLVRWWCAANRRRDKDAVQVEAIVTRVRALLVGKA